MKMNFTKLPKTWIFQSETHSEIIHECKIGERAQNRFLFLSHKDFIGNVNLPNFFRIIYENDEEKIRRCWILMFCKRSSAKDDLWFRNESISYNILLSKASSNSYLPPSPAFPSGLSAFWRLYCHTAPYVAELFSRITVNQKENCHLCVYDYDTNQKIRT